jgi:hypothetical protein
MKLPHVLWRLAAMFFALTAGAHATEFHIKRIDANTVKFDGLITKDSKDALLAALDDRVTMLRITSPGGDLWAGIIIGKFVHDHRIAVEVEDLCASSCANFVFLGAIKKRLLQGAVLGFHGNLVGEMSNEKSAALRRLGEPAEPVARTSPDFLDMFERNQRFELAFRDKVGLRPDFFNYADERVFARWKQLGRKMTEPIQEVVLTEKNNVTHFPPDQLQAALERLETLNKQGIEATVSMEVKLGGKDYSDMIYFPSRKTLERFGITGITDYPYPATEAELKTMNVFKTVPGAIVIGDFEEGALAEVAKTAEMATN